MQINDPAVLAEVQGLFAAYETALINNDVAVLDALFWKDPRTIRYGGGENLYGFEAIAAFRAGRAASGLGRQLEGTVITTFGRNFATCSTLFRREGAPGKVGRQMQSWARLEAGWRIVAAHVSIIGEPV